MNLTEYLLPHTDFIRLPRFAACDSAILRTKQDVSGPARTEWTIMPPTQEPRSCGVILVCGDPVESFLLLRHHDRWDLPKGHVDPGESDVDCALREMEEETGIPRSAVQLDTNFRFVQQYEVHGTRYGGKRNQMVVKTLIIFLARTDRKHALIPTEHQDGKWFKWKPPHSIQKRAIDPLLKQLEDYLRPQKS